MATPEPIKKPTQPPKSFSADALVKALNEARVKVGLPPHVSYLPAWKRWVGGESEFDTTGLRDVVNTYGSALDGRWEHLLNFEGRTDSRLDVLEADVAALKEAPPGLPFPFEG